MRRSTCILLIALFLFSLFPTGVFATDETSFVVDEIQIQQGEKYTDGITPEPTSDVDTSESGNKKIVSGEKEEIKTDTDNIKVADEEILPSDEVVDEEEPNSEQNNQGEISNSENQNPANDILSNAPTAPNAVKPEIETTATLTQMGYLYSEPKNSSKKLDSIPSGTEVEIIEEYYTATWHKVWYNGQTGYVWIGNFKPEITAIGICTGQDVNVREKPNTNSTIFGKLDKGAEIEIIKENYTSGWHQIWYSNAGIAYISADYVRIDNDSESATTGTLAQTGYLYSEPKNTSERLGSIPAGTKVQITKEYYTATWHQVQYDGQTGYVWVGNFKPEIETVGLCTGQDVNVRMEPNTSSTILGKLDKWAQIEIIKTNYTTGWHQIWYEGKTAYLSADYVDIGGEPEIETVDNVIQTANLYSEPKNSSEKLDSIPSGTEVEIIEEYYTTTWHKVWYNGKVGYVWIGNFKPEIETIDELIQMGYLYSEPKNTSDKLDSIPSGSRVEIIKKNYTATWHQVWYNGQIGYVWIGNFKPEIETTDELIQMGYLYSEPNNTSTKLSSIPMGTEVEIVEAYYTATWHKVWYNGQEGYVWIGNFKPEIETIGELGRLGYLYSEPKNTSTKLASIPMGTEVEIIEQNYTATWHKVWYNGQTGYVWIGNFKPEAEVTKELGRLGYLYSEPRNTSEKLTSIPAGTNVDIIKEYYTATWHEVWYDGQTGYVWIGNFKPEIEAEAELKQMGYLYSEPKNTSEKLDSIPAGTEIEIIKEYYTATWHEVWYNGQEGYVWFGNFKPEIETVAQLSQMGYLYSEPKNTSTKLDSIPAGTKVEIIEEYYTATWHEVWYNGQEGYVWLGNFKPEIEATLEIVNGANLYSEPRNTSEKLEWIDAGEKIEIIERNYTATWHKVWYNGQTGYIWIGNFDPEIVATLQTICETDIYTEPDETAEKLATVPKDTSIRVTQKYYTRSWHQVWYDGKTGYVWIDSFDVIPELPTWGELQIQGDKLYATWEVLGTNNYYELWEFSSISNGYFDKTEKGKCLYDGTDTKVEIKSVPTREKYYFVKGYILEGEEKVYTDSLFYLGSFKEALIENFELETTSMVINKGYSKTLEYMLSTDSDAAYTPSVSFSSSNSSIAKVDSDTGVITAISPGSCYITAKVLGGESQRCKVTVPTVDTLQGALSISFAGTEGSRYHLLNMIAGKENRLNGTVISAYGINSITVSIKNESSKTEVRYTKTLTGKETSYNLQNITRNISWSSLSKGEKTLYVTVNTSEGTADVYSKRFAVGGILTGDARGEGIVNWAKSRYGDPYSQPLRGQQLYTDCSYLALWCVRQAFDATIPGTAAGQYQWCVENNKTVSPDELQPGDLIFYGGRDNGRYKGIYHVGIYVGDDLVINAVNAGVSYSPAQIGEEDVFYGRPY